MPINFTQIIKDSWNFIQNEKLILIKLIGLYVAASFLIVLLQSVLLPEQIASIMLNQNGLPKNIPDELISDIIVFFLSKQFLNLFIGAWCLVTIHQVSLRAFMSLTSSFVTTLKRILGTILLSLFIFIPLMIGLTGVFLANQQNISPSPLAMFAMIIGIALYIRLCLAPIHYLLTENSLFESWKTIWHAGKGRLSVLFIFCLLIYVVIPMIENILVGLSINAFVEIIMMVLLGFINVFALIISYRFYTLFVSKA